MDQIMAWRLEGDKPLPEPTMAYFADTYMRHSASMSKIAYQTSLDNFSKHNGGALMYFHGTISKQFYQRFKNLITGCFIVLIFCTTVYGDIMMISWHGNVFRITHPLWWIHWWPVNSLHQCGASLSSVSTNCWTNMRVAGNLRCHDAHMRSL